MNPRSWRPAPRKVAPKLSTVLLALLLPALCPLGAVAAPQEEVHQLRHEVVVVGSQPAHRDLLLEQLADRGYLGLHLLNLTPELRLHFGAPATSGVLVSRVVPESPAAAAGVAVGDVVTSADGEPLRTMSQLVGRMGHRHEGDEIELGIVRDRSPLELRATLAQSTRRRIDVGQFVWHGGEDGRLPAGLDPEVIVRSIAVDPQMIERVISIDPEAVNESISRLLERLEAQGGVPGPAPRDDEQRQQLERRIDQLEERLRAMDRLLRRRQED